MRLHLLFVPQSSQTVAALSVQLWKAAWGIGNRFCSSLVIITWHLIASVAFKSCCLNP